MKKIILLALALAPAVSVAKPWPIVIDPIGPVVRPQTGNSLVDDLLMLVDGRNEPLRPASGPHTVIRPVRPGFGASTAPVPPVAPRPAF